MLRKFNGSLSRIACTIVCAMVLVSLPFSMAAKATGPTVSLSESRVQAGELVKITPNDSCAPVPPDVFYMVLVILTDSNSEEYYDWGDIQIIDSSSGVWEPSLYKVPEGASLGEGTLQVLCARWDDVPDSIWTSYEPINIRIVAQSTKMKVDRVNWGSTSTLSSLAPCSANSSVRVDMYSEEPIGYQNPGVHFATHVSDVVTANSAGHWSYEVPLTPGTGNTINPSESLQRPGESYYFRARCLAGGSTAYDSLRFTTKESRYVALGDSYSSGEGSFNYDIDPGTCHRSSDAYAFYVGEMEDLGTPLMGACSGEQTYGIAHAGGASGVPQRDLLSLDTEVVTLTIGGNDVGFQEVLDRCIQTPIHTGFGCASDPYLPNAVNDRMAGLEGTASSPVYTNGKLVSSITQVLLEIEEYAPNASIYIGGYPQLFGTDVADYTAASVAPGGAVCGLFPGLASVSYNDAQWMNSLAEDLNSIIESEVTYAQGLGVDVEYVTPFFGAHALCDSNTSWLNYAELTGTPPKPLPESIHPTVTGMWQGYGVSFTVSIP